MFIRRAFAVAALTAFAFISGPQGDGWNFIGEAFAKQSNGNAGGNGNKDHGAGNGNGHAAPKANLAPVADAGADRVARVGQPVVLDGGGSVDPDGDPAVFSWEIVAWPTGSLAQLDDPHAVRPAFMVDMPGDYKVRLTLDDGYETGAPDVVVVSTDNLAPAADAGDDRAVMQGATVLLDGANSGDTNGDRISFNWTLVKLPAGSDAAISDPNAARPGFLADLPGDYVAELTVGDGQADSAPDRVIASTGNVAPRANAGADLLAVTAARTHEDDEEDDSDPDSEHEHDGESGGLIALDAELSGDSNGDEIAFRWTVLSAPDGADYRIRNSTERRAFLEFEDSGDYLVQLTVTDHEGAIGFDTTIVSAGNIAPVADAGADRTVSEGDQVTLNASYSTDANGDLLTARWSLISVPADSAAVLSRADSVRPDFTADIAGTYIAQLIVDDGVQRSAADTVIVTTGNVAPVADAGPDLWVGARDGAITLDGGASSDANGDALTYRWSLIDAPRGSHAALSDADSDTAGFAPDRAGTYLAQVVVNDGLTDSAPDFVVIAKAYGNLEPGEGSDDGDGNRDGNPGRGHDTNLRPVADAGPARTVPGGSLIQLDGSASMDPNGHAITHEWALIFKPAGSLAAIDDPAAISPSFTADISGVYVAQLVVRDAQIESFPDTVLIYANTPPVADAGLDQEVALGTVVALDGAGSYDDDGDALGYAWSFASQPAGSHATIDNASSVQASFVPDIFGDYVVQLVVNDGLEDSIPDTATIKTFNNPPVAEAGADQSAVVGDLVTLDGTGSSDPDGQVLSYSWRFTARPAGSTAAFNDTAAAMPVFTVDVQGLYIAELTVNDGVVDSMPDVVGVRVGDGSVNHAPVLDAIGPQTVTLGGVLRLQLTATDSDGDTVYFNASPLPMPNGAHLDAATGEFTFRPDADQIGGYDITLIASDGLARDSESIRISVIAPPPGAITSLTGRLLDADSGTAGASVGVAGATVTLSGITATSDADGWFFLSGVPSGDRALYVNGGTAGAAPDGSAYGSLNVEVSLIADTVNVADDLFVARVDTDGRKWYKYNWFAGKKIVNNRLGVELFVPWGAYEAGVGAYKGYIGISDVPPSLAANYLPSWISPCRVAAFEPYNLVLRTNRRPQASVTFANYDGMVPGSQVDIWNLDPNAGLFRIVGKGAVTADGTQIKMISGRLNWMTMAFYSPPRPRVNASADMNPASRTPTLLADGNVSQAISLPGVMSLGQDRSQTLVYNSRSADPRPIFAADTTILARTGVPALIEGGLEIGGVRVAGPFATNTQSPTPLPENVNATIRHAVNFDAGALDAGAHRARFTATANYGCSKVSGWTERDLVVNNQSDSPFGAGWTLAGLSRLNIDADGDIVLTEGDGAAKSFPVLPEGKFHPPVGIPANVPLAGALDDLNGDGNLDIVVPEAGNGFVRILYGDGAGGFPTEHSFDAGGGFNIWDHPDTHTVATADFNNDGLRDLAVNRQNGGQVRIYLGQADGTYGNVANLGISRPQGIAVADFDGDGNDDLVVPTSGGTFSTDRTYVYFGDGAGGFPVRKAFDLAKRNIAAETGDFNNDGTLDAIILSAGANKAQILLSDGGRGFIVTSTPVAPVQWAIGRYPMALSDFDGDGNLDMALTVGGADYFALYFGDGLGGFSTSVNVPTGIGTVNSLTATDYDEDGDMDVVASGRYTGAIVLFKGDGAGGITVDQTVPLAAGILNTVLAGDFNNDGAPDLHTVGGGNIWTLLADRSGGNRFRSPGADFSALDRNPDGTYTRRMTDGTVIDYNEDGLMTVQIDANGNRTDYAYDSAGLLSGISDPADPTRATTFDYSGAGLEAVTDLAGRTSYFQVDGEGNLISFGDTEANVFRYAYDGDSRLSAFAGARGFVTSVDYGFAGQYLGTNNPDGTSVTASVTGSLGLVDPGQATGAWIAPEDRIAKMQDAKGNIYEIEVNEYGAMIRSTDPIGRTTLIERDANNLVLRTTAPSDSDPSGTLVTEMDYDENGNVIAKREAAGTALARETRFEYDPLFNKTSKVIDPAGGVTAMTYDPANGNLLTITDAQGATQSFTYDYRGLRLTGTDANGNITAFTYDGFYGNMLTSTNGAGEVSKMVRDAAGNMIGVTEGAGSLAERTTSYVFDAMGRTVQLIGPDGGVTETVYDADGNVIAEIDETGIASETEYDSMGRVIGEIHPATGRVAKTYDENGNMESVIDPTGHVAHFQYDAMNRAIRTEDPAGGIRSFAYDAQDKPIEVIDANGNATAFKYDALGREIERRNAPGDVWTFQYDSRDNMVATTDAKNQTIEKNYDAMSRMTRMLLIRADGTTGDDQTYAYDAMGQKTLAYDFDSSLAWTYDGANRVVAAAVHGGVGNAQPQAVLTHAYNAVGERTSLSDSEGGVSWYDHDAQGNLTRVTTAAGDTIDLGYDPAGRLTRIANPNAVETNVLYDALTGRPSRIDTTQGGAPLLPLAYGFDTDGKIASIADNGGTRNFTYDETLQVTGGGYASAPESYAYDPEGNRTASHLSATYQHDSANRLREDEDACYDYDANGNMVSKTARVGALCTGGITTYDWDVLNHLTRIDNPDGTYSAYRYDAQGRRIEKDVNGALTIYVYDGDAILLEFDGANALQARYAHGEEIDQPLAMTRGGQSYFYGTDHLGSVRLLTDAAGAVANRYDYDAFGNWEITSYETVTNPFGYTARERDAESGLMFYRARYYDPEIGRFISEDPIGFEGEDLNLYRYVFNNPVILADPMGQSFVDKMIFFSFVSLAARHVGPFVQDQLFRAALKANPDCFEQADQGAQLAGGAGLIAAKVYLRGAGGWFGTVIATLLATEMYLTTLVMGSKYCSQNTP